MFTVILYSHRDLSEPPYRRCFHVLDAAVSYSARTEMSAPECIAVTSAPQNLPGYWRNIVATGERGHHDCAVKIIAGCEAARHTTVFLVEHDVLYPCGHFDVAPTTADAFYYCPNVWTVSPDSAWPTPDRYLTSTVCADRALMLRQFEARRRLLESGGRIVWDEPGRNDGDIAEPRWLKRSDGTPVVDVRFGGNLTGMRHGGTGHTGIPGWGDSRALYESLGLQATRAQTLPVAVPPERLQIINAQDRRFV